MNKILAFCGKIGSGKDTCCKYLCGAIGTTTKSIDKFSLNDSGDLIINDVITDENTILPKCIKNYKFATPLKEFCINVLGLDRKLVYGSQNDKNKLTHIKWEDFPGVTTNKLLYSSIAKHIKRKTDEHSKFEDPNFKLIYHDPGFMTVREVLQYFGTEVVRQMYSPAWVNATLNAIKSDNVNFPLVSDARFINEFEAIKQAGGKLIKLTRSAESSNHTSEQDFDSYNDFDYVLDNSAPNFSILDLSRALKVALTKIGYFN